MVAAVDVFGNHGLGGLLKEGSHEKSPKCLGGNLGDFGELIEISKISLKNNKGRLKHCFQGFQTTFHHQHRLQDATNSFFRRNRLISKCKLSILIILTAEIVLETDLIISAISLDDQIITRTAEYRIREYCILKQ